jgi:MFS family permease
MNERDHRWNFAMCVGNGSIVSMGFAFFTVETVMAGLVYQLTGDTRAVGVLVSVQAIGWLWPQIIVGSYIEHRERKKPVYTISACLRFGSMLAISILIYYWEGSPWNLYLLIVGLWIIFSSSGGVCVLPFTDVVAKSIPSAWRPMLWAYRQLIGGVLGFLASFVVMYILSERSGIPYPKQYALLTFVGTCICGVAYILFIMTREKIEPVTAQRVPMVTFAKRGPVIFGRDAGYRRFFWFKVFWAVGIMSQSLFVPFAMAYFDASAKLTGTFTGVILLVGGVSSFVWGRVSQRFGEIVLFRVSALVLLLSPLSALVLYGLYHYPPARELVSLHFVTPFVLMFGLGTVAINGVSIASFVHLLALCPPERRFSYIAFMNTISVPLMLLPIVAGVMAREASYALAFGCGAAGALGAFVLACQMKTRVEGEYPDLGLAENGTTE